MPKVIITKGLPGSGKSTWARAQVKKGKGSVKRVNKDELRNMIDNHGNWSSQNEKMIVAIRDKIILEALRKDCDVIVDDTNLHPRMERSIRKLVAGRYPVEVVFFDVPLEECLRRNAERTGDAHVPEDVIRRMHKDWQNWKHHVKEHRANNGDNQSAEKNREQDRKQNHHNKSQTS